MSFAFTGRDVRGGLARTGLPGGAATGLLSVHTCRALPIPPHLYRGTTKSWALAGGADQTEYTFLVFLIPLLIAGLLSLAALRTYPRDVATASASMQAINVTA